MRPLIFGGALVAWAGAACVGPFGLCDFETIEVTMDVTIDRDGLRTADILQNTLAPTNLSGNEYDVVRGALIENQGPGAIFTVPAFDSNGGMVALMFRTPLEVGERLPFTHAFDGGGWGPVDPAVQAGETWISVRDDGFQATAVDGWLEVTAVAPLAFTFDVTASAASGPTLRLVGVGAFRRTEERRQCD